MPKKIPNYNPPIAIETSTAVYAPNPKTDIAIVYSGAGG
jgi:hypothetical protein